MSLPTIIGAVFEAFQRSLRADAYCELLLLDDHALADLGLRRAELRAGLWQPTGTVDGDPSTTPHPSDFAHAWYPPF